MNKKQVIIISEVAMLLALLIALMLEVQSNEQPISTTTPKPTTSVAIVPDVSETNPTITPNPAITAQSDTSQRVPPVSPIREPDGFFAKVTIYTDSKTRTYEVMPDVDEKTLKDNIGWLPSSSLPYEDSTCILMGHRDTDLKILKNCEVGNEITILMNNIEYNYRVSFIDIVDSNEVLMFNTNPNYTLILVTCYPFYYTGHAPKKILYYCIQN